MTAPRPEEATDTPRQTPALLGQRFAPKEHEHPLEEHGHPHEHPEIAELAAGVTRMHLALVDEVHLLSKHEHEKPPKHEHHDLRGHFRGVVRALLAVMESGSLNSEQVKALHAVRVIIGDVHGSNCQHENSVYEENDVLICQDCRAVIKAEAGG